MNKNRIMPYFIIISIIILITSINVNAQWLPYSGHIFYSSPFINWNQPHSSGYNSYSFNMPYNNSGFFPPYGDYYGSNSSYGKSSYTYTSFPLPDRKLFTGNSSYGKSSWTDSLFNPPYGDDWYSVAPGIVAPTPDNPLYKEGLFQGPSPEYQEILRYEFEKYGYNAW